jgi:hypothetical protein
LLFDDIFASGKRILYSAFSSATDILVETTGMDEFFAAILFLGLTTTTAAGGFFFAAAVMEEEEHPKSGCGALFLNFGGFFATLLFAIKEDGRSGFG